MPDLSAVAPSLAIGVLLVFMLWFAIGTQVNIRRGNAVLRWLQGGLPVLAPRTTLRWLGSSVAELTLVDLSPPFGAVQVMVVLEPRDVSVLWAWARARGRRDFMIVRANLRRAPRVEFDAIASSAWASDIVEERIRDRLQGPSDWQRDRWVTGTNQDVAAAVAPGIEVTVARRAWAALERTGVSVWRLSVQQTVPHLELHVLPPARNADAGQFARAVRDLAAEARGPESR